MTTTTSQAEEGREWTGGAGWEGAKQEATLSAAGVLVVVVVAAAVVVVVFSGRGGGGGGLGRGEDALAVCGSVGVRRGCVGVEEAGAEKERRKED
jgi:hypothetical protein